MFCHVCGTQISEDARFCHKCGAKVVTDASNIELNEKGLEAVNLLITFKNIGSLGSSVMDNQELDVTVDGKKMGQLRNGETAEYKILPGQHHIALGSVQVCIETSKGNGLVQLMVQPIVREEGALEYQLSCEPSCVVIPDLSDEETYKMQSNQDYAAGVSNEKMPMLKTPEENCCTKVVYGDSMGVQKEESVFNDKLAGEEEEKLDAILSKVGLDKVHTVKAIREWTGIEPEEAEELFEKVPVLLKKAVTLKEAREIKATFAKERAEITFTDSKGRSVDIDRGEDCDHGKGKTWGEKSLDALERLFGVTSKLPVFWRWFLGISCLVCCGLFIVFSFSLLFKLIRLIFSSFIHIIIAVAVGYILYLTVFAEVITEYQYKKESKQLRLPEGMSVSMLLEALSGKFNYPYFKGVHYGPNGECVIEGNYSTYPVIFKKYNYIVLECTLKENDKKKRTVLLEAMLIRNYINKFFNPTLSISTVGGVQSLKFAEGQRKVVAIISAAVSVLIMAVGVWYFISPGSLESRLGNIIVPGIEVRSAYLSQYSKSVTIEEAFENFFDNCKWSVNNSGDYPEVIFTGVFRYDGERADARIVFKISGEHFIADSLDINGRRQSDFMLNSMLSAVYEDY